MSRQACFVFLFALVLTSLLSAYAQVQANWERGRIYSRLVYSACHKAETGNTISSDIRSMAESRAYMAAARHRDSANDIMVCDVKA